MLRTGLTILLAAHGIGHILFLVPLLGLADWGQPTRSWLFTQESGARLFGSLIWIAVILIFGVTVFGLLNEQPWWRTAAVIASVISILGLVLFWANPVTSPVIAALAFNLVVLAALLLLNWPSPEAVGA